MQSFSACTHCFVPSRVTSIVRLKCWIVTQCFLSASWNHGDISRQGPSCLKMSGDVSLRLRPQMKPACVLHRNHMRRQQQHNVIFLISPDKTFPPQKNTTVAHKSDLAFLVLESRIRSRLRSPLLRWVQKTRHSCECCITSRSFGVRLGQTSFFHLCECTDFFSCSSHWGTRWNPLISCSFAEHFFCLLSSRGEPLSSRWVKGGGFKQDRGFNKRWCCLVWF